MGILTYVLGRSGTGKSYSMRNFDKSEIAVINVQGKILPFKGSGSFDVTNTDDSTDIVKAIKEKAQKYKVIVVDDFQYVMANEFMRRAAERGYDKFTEIARHAWDIADCVRTLPADVIMYVMCHTDTDQDGFEKLKTIGKLLDEKIVLEGMSTIVLKTAVSDGQYMFLTQNNGKDTVKSPSGMFPAYAINNDLKYVDQKIRNYYEIGDFKSDEEMAEKDEAVKHEEVAKDEPKKRGRSRGKKEEEKPAEASEEKAETEAETDGTDTTIDSEGSTGSDVPEDSSGDSDTEKPKRSRRRKMTEDPEGFMFVPDDEAETMPFPQRKDRSESQPETATTEEEAPVKRRRRRS